MCQSQVLFENKNTNNNIFKGDSQVKFPKSPCLGSVR